LIIRKEKYKVYITKKDLLVETDISYGQLYRWKRERLIPEEWFIKQSSYTGQETVFPKEQILQRIQYIKKMKDEHSLEDIAKMLDKGINDKIFNYDRVLNFSFVNGEVAKLYKLEEYSYGQLFFMKVLSELLDRYSLGNKDFDDIISNMSYLFENIQKNDKVLILFENDNMYHAIISATEDVKLDARFRIIAKFDIFKEIENIKSISKEEDYNE